MCSLDDRVVRLLTDEANRAVLEALDDAGSPLSIDELAAELVSQETFVVDELEYDECLERARISLYHARLPKLDEAGLVEYDPETAVVSLGVLAPVAAQWEEIELIDELLSRFETGIGDERKIGVLEGRDEVYEYARELAGRADEELFLIYTSGELLDEECLPHAERAIDRDVDFYAGVKDRSARRFFDRQLPEATIWEPQLDWLYDPTQPPTISRLVFVDRETVVVGLWEEDDDGAKTELGMVGDGRANPLVTLVRELLGPRLEHLDYQSDQFLDELPFES
ncbi:DUF7344 domain-containing protein [Natrialba swarupiae]|uniref:ArsR family transcriptional regulator n=1 Tax=Natrialba swarupiae TaxID=2448032 RepID=A0A5D5ASH2_9EURY|nr:ArsR family transcriptional regulator [Natrialba swarupiae]TYT62782.1 ArsR family transcriptional regulator [Natrialba swarupiae]